jgi:hypothetical protein
MARRVGGPDSDMDQWLDEAAEDRAALQSMSLQPEQRVNEPMFDEDAPPDQSERHNMPLDPPLPAAAAAAERRGLAKRRRSDSDADPIREILHQAKETKQQKKRAEQVHRLFGVPVEEALGGDAQDFNVDDAVSALSSDGSSVASRGTQRREKRARREVTARIIETAEDFIRRKNEETKKLWLKHVHEQYTLYNGSDSRRDDDHKIIVDSEEEQRKADDLARRAREAFELDTADAAAKREVSAEQEELAFLQELEQRASDAQKEYVSGEEEKLVYCRRFIAADRLRDAGNSKGWMRMNAILRRLDTLGYTRSKLQKLFHHRFVQAILPLYVQSCQTPLHIS